MLRIFEKLHIKFFYPQAVALCKKRTAQSQKDEEFCTLQKSRLNFTEAVAQ